MADKTYKLEVAVRPGMREYLTDPPTPIPTGVNLGGVEIRQMVSRALGLADQVRANTREETTSFVVSLCSIGLSGKFENEIAQAAGCSKEEAGNYQEVGDVLEAIQAETIKQLNSH